MRCKRGRRPPPRAGFLVYAGVHLKMENVDVGPYVVVNCDVYSDGEASRDVDSGVCRNLARRRTGGRSSEQTSRPTYLY